MATSVAGPLRVDGVDVTLGGHRILHHIRLVLHPGEMCALIGPSGAGKSTLIRVLLGVLDPDEGRVTVGGRPVEEAGPLGYVPQEDALHRGLTVERELGYAAELRMPDAGTDERRARIDRVLAQVGLTERADVRIRNLSGGQRKRVSVALELLTRPPLLILDEPTSGLDPGLEARSMALFSEVAAEGHTVLVATHAMESLDRADALCVLVKGHVAFFGPPASALAFFRVERYADLFRQLEKQPPNAWAITRDADPEQRAFLSRVGPAVRAVSPRGGRATAPAAPAGDRPGDEPSASDADRALAELKARMREEDPS